MKKRTQTKSFFRRINFHTIIDNHGKLFGKVDLFFPLFILISITLAYFIGRVLLQKETYVEVQLFASGGEWWWQKEDPPYWLVDPVTAGAVEYDPSGNPLVQILEVRKFEVGNKKMLWMRAKLRVTPADKAKQYRFRREPLQIGSVIYVAPNNVKIFCNVTSVEGVDVKTQEEEKTITLKEYNVFPWLADQITIGDTMKDDNGSVLAEVIDKKVELAEMTTSDAQGKTHQETNPAMRDFTVKLKIKTTRSQNIDYFSYFQPLKVGFYLWIPLSKMNISGNISAIE